MPRLTHSVRRAAAAIRAGRVVGYPTETVYGIGALALSEKTVRSVITLKGTAAKPMSLAVSSLAMIDAVAHVPDAALVRTLLPGPYTVLLPKKDVVPPLLTAGSACVGIRYPAHSVACDLIDAVGEPITSTSANLTGDPPATRAGDIALDVACVLDGGTASLGPSTVVDLVHRTVIRRGAGYDSLERAGLLRTRRRGR